MSNVFISVVRSVVPMVVGAVVAFAAWAGLDVDSAQVGIVVTAVVGAVYYTLFRLLEDVADRINNPRLRTVAGWLLGVARPPQYPEAAKKRDV